MYEEREGHWPETAPGASIRTKPAGQRRRSTKLWRGEVAAVPHLDLSVASPSVSQFESLVWPTSASVDSPMKASRTARGSSPSSRLESRGPAHRAAVAGLRTMNHQRKCTKHMTSFLGSVATVAPNRTGLSRAGPLRSEGVIRARRHRTNLPHPWWDEFNVLTHL